MATKKNTAKLTAFPNLQEKKYFRLKKTRIIFDIKPNPPRIRRFEIFVASNLSDFCNFISNIISVVQQPFIVFQPEAGRLVSLSA
ncbi:hypothetical protein KSMBR1_0995 [Candidatus Kuenenia stuttgartiensis]|uniref:Uncharacterized protein n=1 Tax=Kuenenia stuttgartiensis TaxID=174633 RepID=A0A2C9CCR6_KUEST|nr:hypothetical protein KSMBR1_0995 [Candidatus Kuenenia stuttgartiensis]